MYNECLLPKTNLARHVNFYRNNEGKRDKAKSLKI